LTVMTGLVLLMIGMGTLMRPHEYAHGAADTVTWPQLARGVSESKGPPIYAQNLEALDGKEISITGYMFPFTSAEQQKHFLLSGYPPTCPFCLPGGASEMIEVTTASATIPYTVSPTTLRGTFHLMKTPDELAGGMLYVMEGAKGP
jgi:hypothetical protein